jgi:hypothetical protein
VLSINGFGGDQTERERRASQVGILRLPLVTGRCKQWRRNKIDTWQDTSSIKRQSGYSFDRGDIVPSPKKSYWKWKDSNDVSAYNISSSGLDKVPPREIFQGPASLIVAATSPIVCPVARRCICKEIGALSLQLLPEDLLRFVYKKNNWRFRSPINGPFDYPITGADTVAEKINLHLLASHSNIIRVYRALIGWRRTVIVRTQMRADLSLPQTHHIYILLLRALFLCYISVKSAFHLSHPTL